MRQTSLSSVQGGPEEPVQEGPRRGNGTRRGHLRFVQWHPGDDLSHNALDILKGLLLIYYILWIPFMCFHGFCVSVSACVFCALSFFFLLCLIILAFLFSVPVCLLEGEKSVGLSRWEVGRIREEKPGSDYRV